MCIYFECLFYMSSQYFHWTLRGHVNLEIESFDLVTKSTYSRIYRRRVFAVSESSARQSVDCRTLPRMAGRTRANRRSHPRSSDRHNLHDPRDLTRPLPLRRKRRFLQQSRQGEAKTSISMTSMLGIEL